MINITNLYKKHFCLEILNQYESFGTVAPTILQISPDMNHPATMGTIHVSLAMIDPKFTTAPTPILGRKTLSSLDVFCSPLKRDPYIKRVRGENKRNWTLFTALSTTDFPMFLWFMIVTPKQILLFNNVYVLRYIE